MHDILFVMPDLVVLLFHSQFLIVIISIIVVIIFNLCDCTAIRTVNTEWIQDISETETMLKESFVT